MKGKLIILALASVLSGSFCFGETVLRFEAEDWSEPRDAWIKDRDSENKWNLWSQDKDADKKWSGGVVLRSPAVKADRASGEEGAPVLHTVIVNIPPGKYDVYMNGTRAIGISRDGKTWEKTTGGLLFEDVEIRDGRFELWVDDRFANEGNLGPCYYDYLEFRPAPKIRPARPGNRILAPADFPPVRGWAKTRVEEKLDRGVVALPTSKGVYVSWRLLKSDPPNAAFDIYCQQGNGPARKLNARPIVATSDFLHEPAPHNPDVTYIVCLAGTNLRSGSSARLSMSGAEDGAAAFISIKLKDDKTLFQKIAIADLNGDGKLDYVIKHPNGNVDPWVSFWVPSPETYKLEAYLHDGTYLWTRDLGWSIERGIWYSPYLVADLNGDGKAEVAVKTGEGDPRDPDGKVTSGPEWLSVWDGLTGRELTRAPWPSREGFLGMQYDYNYYSRNQLALAYLDGKTPCLLALRGTYNLMKVDAYQFHNNQLQKLWSYSNAGLDRKFWGQGEHFTHAVDVDDDGRDEVMLGSVMLDDNGCPLWTTGLGHNDAGYVTDVLPDRPGLEIFYIIETAQPRNGMCLADARTGEILWGYAEPTTHVHGAGMCADIDPLHPGLECWGADSVEHKVARGPWLWSAAGELLAFEDPTLPKSFDITTVFWDADLQKECLFGKQLCDFRGTPVSGIIQGSVVLIADVLGDWREEVITSVPGEIRIYSTTVPAFDRRVCLLQDRVYRADVRMNSMGYTKVPSLSFCPAAQSVNVNLTLMPPVDKTRRCRVVVTAPLTKGVEGTLTLSGGVLKVQPEVVTVAVKPGQLQVIEAELFGEIPDDIKEANYAQATLTTPQGILCTRVPTHLPKPSLRKYQTALPRVEAEAFCAQGGGEVRIRNDKPNVSDRAISHWDSQGHWLEWRLNIPESSRYELVFRYSTPNGAVREASLDGHPLGRLTFPGTGGFGDMDRDWRELPVNAFSGSSPLFLTAGAHILRLTNIDGAGLNLDFIGYRKLD